jgi:hypothetical protein
VASGESEVSFARYEMQVMVDGDWASIRPKMETQGKVAPYRYENEKDAELMLQRLYPEEEDKRVVVAKAMTVWTA